MNCCSGNNSKKAVSDVGEDGETARAETPVGERVAPEERKEDVWKWAALGLFGALAFTQVFDVHISAGSRPSAFADPQGQLLRDRGFAGAISEVLPEEGTVLPVVWGDLGRRMLDAGVIDREKFESLYAGRGGVSDEVRSLLFESDNGGLEVTRENANEILNLLWAFGLSNKNRILEEGPMVDKRYGGDAGAFASTGGWTLAEGDAMDHYSAYPFVVLSGEQQKLVERVSKNIYRPCCNNPVYFPDCNHGMAMLGLLELLAAEGVGEEEMYSIALQINAYWFPDPYATAAKYFSDRGVSWNEVDPKKVLGSTYSSASGYRNILAEVEPVQQQGGGGCGV